MNDDKTFREHVEWKARIMNPEYSETDQEEFLGAQAERLLLSLYEPSDTHPFGWVADGDKVRAIGLRDEAINWGDLHVVNVIRREDDSFLVEIEEVDPDAPILQAWMADWLGRWGWNVEVRTAW